MFLHLVIVTALLSTGTHHGRVAGSAVAFVHRIPAETQALRLDARSRAARPAIERAIRPVAQVPERRFSTLATQLRR